MAQLNQLKERISRMSRIQLLFLKSQGTMQEVKRRPNPGMPCLPFPFLSEAQTKGKMAEDNRKRELQEFSKQLKRPGK
jgi:hypothetical protein